MAAEMSASRMFEASMKLIYSGKTKEFTSELEAKIGTKLAKLSKLIEQRGEREAHICHHVERRLHKVEIIVNFYDHALVGEGTDADLDTAVTHAVDKLEKQVVKVRARWRDTHRDKKSVRSTKEDWETGAPAEDTATGNTAQNPSRNGNPRTPRIFRISQPDGKKPMTLEEAIIEMESARVYVVYRDSDRNCLSVLVRRPDGNFDLIES